MRFYIHEGAEQTALALASSPVPLGEWTTIICRFEASRNLVNVWMDGNDVTTDESAYSQVISSSCPSCFTFCT